MASTSRLGTRILSLLVLATLGAANVLYRSGAHDVFPLHPRQEELSENDPSCTPSCDLDTCGGGVCGIASSLSRRGLGLEGLTESFAQLNLSGESHHNVLTKRLFRYDTSSNTYTGDRNPTAGEVDVYLPAVFGGGEDDYFGGALLLVHDDGGNDRDERAVSQQRPFGNDPFHIMTGGLHGCTVVALVSRRAVWMAHFWESYSHGQPNRDTPATDGAFVDRVIKHLRGEKVINPAPSTYKPYIPPTGPGIDASLFNEDTDETKLFIMTPVADGQAAGSTKIKYATRIPAIETAVRRHIGRRPENIRYNYQRLDYNDPDDQGIINRSHRGMALFQYDPNSDGRGQRAWRLFLENSFYTREL